MLFKFILTIKPLHLIKCCCSNIYKYKLLSGGQLSGVNCPGGKKYPTLSNLTIYIYIYVRVFLQISASLHDNAKLARVGVARAAPAHGLTELFLIKYFALLYVRSTITLHDPFLRIIIWTT